MSSNRFPTTCDKPSCRRRIDAGKGTHNGKVAGRHTYVCTGTCDGSLPAEPIVPERTTDMIVPGCRFPVSSWLFNRITETIRENRDDVDMAWDVYVMENEYFDGEDEIMAGAKVTFYAVARAYLTHPDIQEAREFSRLEAEQEMDAYR